MSAAAVVWVNGRLEKAGEASLSVTDRGFQLGDGVFETFARRRGDRPRAGGAHEPSQCLCGCACHRPACDLEAVLARAIAQVCAANGLDGPGAQAAVRVTASRGPVDGRALLPPADASPTLVVQAWPVEPPPQSVLERGLRLVISSVRRDPASPLARVKTTSRAEFVYARLEAQQPWGRRRLVPHHRGLPGRGDVGQPLPRGVLRVGDALARVRHPRQHHAGLGPVFRRTPAWSCFSRGPAVAGRPLRGRRGVSRQLGGRDRARHPRRGKADRYRCARSVHASVEGTARGLCCAVVLTKWVRAACRKKSRPPLILV